jgi:hypothetical protein
MRRFAWAGKILAMKEQIRKALEEGGNILFIVSHPSRSRTGESYLFSFYTHTPERTLLLSLNLKIAELLRLRHEGAAVRFFHKGDAPATGAIVKKLELAIDRGFTLQVL